MFIWKKLSSLTLAGLLLSGVAWTAGCRARVPVDRSDAGITARVKSQLKAHSDLNVRYLDIYTHMRVVTLSGMVDSRAQKRKISHLVRRIPGVRQVIINLVVKD
jgi:osmotically-inducible protein OsmY